MRKSIILLGVILGVLGFGLTAFSENNSAKINLPSEYRSWTHVKSMIILPEHGLANPFEGIHHIYANEKAVEGSKTGNFSDGSILVFDLLKTVEGGDVVQEGARILTGVMKKSGKDYASTDGWGYEGFAEGNTESRLVTDRMTQCHSCHISTADTGFVFSKIRP